VFPLFAVDLQLDTAVDKLVEDRLHVVLLPERSEQAHGVLELLDLFPLVASVDLLADLFDEVEVHALRILAALSHALVAADELVQVDLLLELKQVGRHHDLLERDLCLQEVAVTEGLHETVFADETVALLLALE